MAKSSEKGRFRRELVVFQGSKEGKDAAGGYASAFPKGRMVADRCPEGSMRG
jgi:hypothetical protein